MPLQFFFILRDQFQNILRIKNNITNKKINNGITFKEKQINPQDSTCITIGPFIFSKSQFSEH